MSKSEKISLGRAESVAKEFCRKIAPWCEKIMIVGSIRRQKPIVHDIDIVIMPKPGGGAIEIIQWARSGHGNPRLVKLGKSLIQIFFQAIQVDLYLATPETWWTLVLIRTGSKEHNIKMCIEAKEKGMMLHADGRGLYDSLGYKIGISSEEEFFKRLGLPYKIPQERG